MTMVNISMVNPQMDHCLTIADEILRRKAIAWRCNTYGAHKRCVCGQPFRRTHIDGCIEVYFPPSLGNHLAIRDGDIGDNPKLLDTSYCIIDSLLNHMQYIVFAEIMDIVEECLQQSGIPLDLDDNEEDIPASPPAYSLFNVDLNSWHI